MPSDLILSRTAIVEGLRALGVRAGMILMVHSSLSSLGQVAGGADTVIDALLAALGPTGTLLMPTHTARREAAFDPDTTPSAMGVISEVFRKRPGVLRSRHPYHPVAAYGPRAADLLRDHEQSELPDGPDTPYGRLVAFDGWVLHIGCDLDTLTLLHAVEAELNLPYLRELSMRYLDAGGQVHTLEIKRCPGGHRGGVLKFDRLFRMEGAMAVGLIGRAMCRLLSAPKAATIMRREMGRDPTFALDDNPHCADCVRFRGMIKAARLAAEAFRLSVPLWTIAPHALGSPAVLNAAAAVIRAQGISWVELDGGRLDLAPASLDQLRAQLMEAGLRVAALHCAMDAPEIARGLPAAAHRLGAAYLRLAAPERAAMPRPALATALHRLLEEARDLPVTLLLGNRTDSHVETALELAALIAEIGSPRLLAAFDPAASVRAGEHPFYNGLYTGPLRRYLGQVDLRDVAAADGQTTRLGYGNAEIVEIISGLRCRTFEGVFCLWPLGAGDQEAFQHAAGSFWHIMDAI